ncbi:MAG: hypothetical protein CM15mV8_1560 [Caudoviricetes sp.]|nr:MAG: hypothetical protein CM15mV8_1560 [Caudoviricetes sp.]
MLNLSKEKLKRVMTITMCIKSVIEKIENIEHKLDEKHLGKTEFKIEEEKNKDI